MKTIDHATYLYSSVIAAATGSIYLFNLTDYIYSGPITCFALPYFAVDFFFCNPSNKVHHVCAAWLICTLFWAPQPAISLFMYKMELTTLLFNALPYVPARAKAPLMGAFMAAFTKVRVVEGYSFLKEMEGVLEGNLHLRVPLYALYAVNLYWFTLMLKKVWGKDRAKGPQYLKLTQKIAAFSYLGVIPATAHCLPLLGGHSFIALTSYFYHGANAVDRPSRFWFVADSVAVHAVMLMNVYIIAREWLRVSAAINVYFLLFRISKGPNEAISLTSISILIDSAFIMGADVSNLFKLDYMLHIYGICLIFYVEFFNDLSYVAFHVLGWSCAHTVASFYNDPSFRCTSPTTYWPL